MTRRVGWITATVDSAGTLRRPAGIESAVRARVSTIARESSASGHGGRGGCCVGPQADSTKPVRTATRSSMDKTCPTVLRPLMVTIVRRPGPQYVPGLYEIIRRDLCASATATYKPVQRFNLIANDGMARL